MNSRILMIVTSNARMGVTGRPTGLWAEELAVPYYALVDAGAEVTLASPAGGPAPIDPGSLKPAGQNAPVVERFLADSGLQARIAKTSKASDFDGAEFDAVFFPGGHGTMWDLPVDAGVTRAVERAFAAQRLIASVCHGAAGLVTAQRPDGQSIVKDLRVNSFTDAEEMAVGLEKVVPFMLETRLRELGGRFEGAGNWQAFAIRDSQLITGQNPQSSHLVAQELLKALTVATGGMTRRSMLITGASSGIGAATARAAVRAGLNVALLGRSKERLDALVAELGPEHALALPGDATEFEQQARAVEAAVARFGGLDVVFANAGTGISKPGTEHGDPEEWRRVIAINVMGVLWTVKLTLPHLRTRKGHFLVTSSVAGRTLHKGSIYGASKWFVHGFGLNLAEEMAEWGGRCTILSPGMVDTPFFDTPKPTKLKPEDIADAAMFAVLAPPRANVREIFVAPSF